MMETKKKNVPKLRFPEFKDEWKEVQLKEVIGYTKGYAFKSNTYQGSGVRIIKVSDLGTENIKDDNKTFVDLEVVSGLNKYKIKKNDIIITTVGSHPDLIESSVGRAFFIIRDDLGYLNQNMLKIDETNNLNSKYLSNYFKGKKYFHFLKAIKRGNANQANITVKELLQYKIGLTDIKEQQKIASFLSAVDQKIHQLQRKKELLQAYKKGMMQQLFSQQLRFKDNNGNNFPEWEEKKLKNILIDYKLGGNYRNSESITDRPLIKMGNLGRGNISLEKIQYISDDEEVDRNDLIEYGDLFFNTRNTLELVGKVAIWRNELAIAYYNSNLMRLKFENNFFMNYRLNSYEGIKGLKKYATGTTSVAAIYTRDLLKLKLNIPCLEEQTKIATFLSALDAKIDRVSTAITQIQDFKKGLLQQMFV